jgi:outer membrane lipoprotein-sorting protein
MRKVFLLVILFLIVQTVDAAKSNFLPKTFNAEFVKKEVSSLSNKERSTKGKMSYKYPSKVRFEILGDDPITFVENSKKYWFYRPPFGEEKGELRVNRTGKQTIAKFFDILKSGLKSNKLYKVFKLKDGSYKVSFSKEKSKELGISKVNLSFNGKKPSFKKLKEMKIHYQDKKSVRFEFTKIEVNKKISSKRFIFETPPNTNVIK